MPVQPDPDFAPMITKAIGGKAHFFALVSKGADIALTLSKKPIKGSAIKTLKKDLGGGAVYEGLVAGAASGLEFQSLDEIPSKFAKAIKNYISEHGGKSTKPVFKQVAKLGTVESAEQGADPTLIKSIVSAIKGFDATRKSTVGAIKAEHGHFAAVKTAAGEAKEAAKAGDSQARETVKLAISYADTFKTLRSEFEAADKAQMTERAVLAEATDKRAGPDALKNIPAARVAKFEAAAKAAFEKTGKGLKLLERIRNKIGL